MAESRTSTHKTLPRSVRVRSREVFVRAFRKRLRAADKWLVLHAVPNELGFARLGISVGRKYGGAVKRNRVKRLIREAFRGIRHEIGPGVDWIVVPRPGPLPALDELTASLRGLSSRLRERIRAC